MLKLATDEDFSGPLIGGLLRAEPALEIKRAVDAGLSGKLDEDLLDWAAAEGRIMLTRDANTMIASAIRRVVKGTPMPGLFVVTQQHVSRDLIDQLLLYSIPAEQGGFRLPNGLFSGARIDTSAVMTTLTHANYRSGESWLLPFHV